MQNENNTFKYRNKIYSAFLGSIITSLFVTPLDVLRIRLQIKKNYKKNSFYKNSINKFSSFNILANIFKKEGFKSLWSGLTPTIIMQVPNTIIYMVLYDELSNIYLPSFGFSKIESAIISGGFSRIISSTIVAPLELIKTQIQSTSDEAKIGIKRKINHIFKNNLSFYKGLKPTLLRDVPFSMIYWGFYQKFNLFYSQSISQNIFLNSFISGATAGSIAAIVTTPFDLIKTRQQIDNLPKIKVPIIKYIYKIKKEEGLLVLFKGVIPRIFKISLSCGIMISNYELGKIYFN